MLQSLNLELKFKGPLSEFIHKLREQGKGEIEFLLDADFREKFGLNMRKVEFKNHVELDEFVHKLLEAEPDFEEKYKDEWALLKSFDRFVYFFFASKFFFLNFFL